jgi:threonine synthase
VISVPSGNFGDLTAGLLAKSWAAGEALYRRHQRQRHRAALPERRQVGAERTQATLSNAMDVSQPNNWPRVEELFRRKIWRLGELGYAAVTDETTKHHARAESGGLYL